MKIKVTVDAAVMPDLSKELKNVAINQKATLNVGKMEVKSIERNRTKEKVDSKDKSKDDEYNELI